MNLLFITFKILDESGIKDYYEKLLFIKKTNGIGYYENLFKILLDIPKFSHYFIKKTGKETVEEKIEEGKKTEEEKKKNAKKYKIYHLFLISLISCKPSLVEYFYNFENVIKNSNLFNFLKTLNAYYEKGYF